MPPRRLCLDPLQIQISPPPPAGFTSSTSPSHHDWTTASKTPSVARRWTSPCYAKESRSTTAACHHSLRSKLSTVERVEQTSSSTVIVVWKLSFTTGSRPEEMPPSVTAKHPEPPDPHPTGLGHLSALAVDRRTKVSSRPAHLLLIVLLLL